MNYLARLKAANFTGLPAGTTAKTAISTSDSFGGSQGGLITENASAKHACVREEPAGCGAARYPARLAPANSENVATRAAAITARSPYDGLDGTTVTSSQEGSDPPLIGTSPAEPDELRKLVTLILAGAEEADREEALTVALADTGAALTSFRALAADLQPHPLHEYDDRRTCEQCANLDRHRGRDGFRRCAAARRVELPYVASRDYSPVPDQPRRCEGFGPLPDDPDRRTGRERWPALAAKIDTAGSMKNVR